MKKFLLYIVSAIMFAACSSEQIELAEQTNEKTPNATPNTNGEEEAWPWGEGVSVSVPDLEIYGDKETTRALVYNIDKRIMKFTWKNSSTNAAKDGDKIGVFPVNSNSALSQQQCFVMTEDPIVVGDNSVSARFMKEDDGVLTVEAEKQYVSYFPYVTGDFDYSCMPVTYLGQEQTANVNIKAYVTRGSMESDYRNSEIQAAKHLEPYDYLVSNATSEASGNIHFVYTRLGSTVRFFIKAPETIVYDSIQLVNKDASFMVEGTMDILEKTLTPKKTSHVMSMKFNPGFDLSIENNQNPNNHVGYIMAYMMLAPIQLNRPEISQCYLYMCGHVKDHPEQKKYFRSNPLTKYDIEQNKTLQWSPTFNPDEPITFNAISVEEWKEGTTFSNGDDGKGTEGW